ncbi:hypothetical protein FGB62_25g38 [Gracilaria domingensis]|nr:hypothetical protein FGB62_25g38 [Gracilaria domingensis]
MLHAAPNRIDQKRTEVHYAVQGSIGICPTRYILDDLPIQDTGTGFRRVEPAHSENGSGAQKEDLTAICTDALDFSLSVFDCYFVVIMLKEASLARSLIFVTESSVDGRKIRRQRIH